MRLGKIAHQHQNNAHNHTTPERPAQSCAIHFAARCSQPLSTNQTPHPTTKVERQTDSPARPCHQDQTTPTGFPERTKRARACCLKAQ
jgi:hypothetical protein